MQDKITFYYNPMSRGRIVHWMLEECRADYEVKLLDWSKKENKSPEYLKINPMGKIPSIVHKGTVVTEAAAICAYLADAFPEANLAPATQDPRRGSYYRWLFFTVNCLDPAVMDKNHPRIQSPPPMALGYGTYEDTMNTLQGAIKDGYLLGEQFTAADLYLSSCLGWYLMQNLIEKNEVLVSYLERCTQREAFQRFTASAGSIS